MKPGAQDPWFCSPSSSSYRLMAQDSCLGAGYHIHTPSGKKSGQKLTFPLKTQVCPLTSYWPEGNHMVCLPPLSCLFPLFSIFVPPSVAKALGVTTVAAQAMKVYREHPIFSEVVSDQEAVAALEKFVGMYVLSPFETQPCWLRIMWLSVWHTKGCHSQFCLLSVCGTSH